MSQTADSIHKKQTLDKSNHFYYSPSYCDVMITHHNMYIHPLSIYHLFNLFLSSLLLLVYFFHSF